MDFIPEQENLIREELVAEDNLSVMAGVVNVQFVRGDHEAVGPDTLVVRRMEPGLFQTHAHVNVVNGHQGDGVGHLVNRPGSEAGEEVSSSAAVWRVHVGRLDLLWDEIFTGVVPDGYAVQEQLSHIQVFAPVVITLTLQEIHHVVRVGENVVISIKEEICGRTPGLHPVQEQNLLEREVVKGIGEVPLQDVLVPLVLQLQKSVYPLLLEADPGGAGQEHGADPHAVLQSLCRPRLAQNRSPLVVPRGTFDGQQEDWFS